MIRKRVADLLSIQYEKRLLIFEPDGFRRVYDYLTMLRSEKYRIVFYDDIEAFRLRYEKEIKKSASAWAIIVQDDRYVLYDIRRHFYEVRLSLGTVLPKLNEAVLQKHVSDLDIISFAYDELYADKLSEAQTERFLSEKVFSKGNVRNYCNSAFAALSAALFSIGREEGDEECGMRTTGKRVTGFGDWIEIAKAMAKLEVYEAMIGKGLDTSSMDEAFIRFVLDHYQKLSGEVDMEAPPILAKVFDFISHGKVALIVMDGMSLFDFHILSRYFDGITYEFQCSFALIPTTTAISRQCLLSGKYPRQLDNPFSLGKEERYFYEAAKEHGYPREQAMIVHGYDAELSPFTRMLAVILNDVDDIVHGQKQGRAGMFHDITLLAESGKLQRLIRSLHRAGFAVYLTSDHGNTACKGVGFLRNTGVEVETKAKRMVIFKDFAEMEQGIAENTIEYPAYYLDKKYRYRVCKPGVSFDSKGSVVMTHGGITTDEVIVPFVTIKAVEE